MGILQRTIFPLAGVATPVGMLLPLKSTGAAQLVSIFAPAMIFFSFDSSIGMTVIFVGKLETLGRGASTVEIVTGKILGVISVSMIFPVSES